MSSLARAIVALAPTKRRRFLWCAWWTGTPTVEDFRPPDAWGGGATSEAEARASEEGLARLRRAFERYRELILGSSYQQAFGGPHLEFHIGLAELSQNPFFPPVVETLLRAVPQSLRESEFNTLGEAELRDLTTLPILLKGVLTAEDALLAAERGVDGLIVSNHDGGAYGFRAAPDPPGLPGA